MKQVEQQRHLSDKEMLDLAEKCFEFCKTASGVKLYSYQENFALRMIQSIIMEDGEEITALFSRQSGKCLALGTKVRMFDGSVKCIEDVQPGEQVMGPDGAPRNVLSTARGREEMFEIKSRVKLFDNYTVNRSHILVLRDVKTNEVVDKPLEDFLTGGDDADGYRGVASGLIEYNEQQLDIDPYFLGLWLGDGTSCGPRVTTCDEEIEEYLGELADILGMRMKSYSRENSVASTYAITNENHSGKPNRVTEALRGLDMLNNKHIPQAILANSSRVRLRFLAGLIDSDGHKDSSRRRLEIMTKYKHMAVQLQELCRSLGFRAAIYEAHRDGAEYYRVPITGDRICDIPSKVLRKRVQPLDEPKEHLGYRFDIVPKGVGDYAGFTLDGDGRFLLSSYAVTHNTETVSCVITGLCVILPSLAQMPELAKDERIGKFKDGFWVGIFAPSYELAGIMHARMSSRMSSESMQAVLSDPDIGIDLQAGRKVLRLPNGSYVDANSAGPQAHIEGKTYHAIICEECQDISNYKILKSIHPMLASTNGTIIKIGTPNAQKGNFYDACERNRARSLSNMGLPTHFQYDYEWPSRFNPRYRKYIEKEIERLGYDSDEFRMSYRLHWLLERGHFIPPEIFESCGITKRDKLRVKKKGEYVHFKRPDSPYGNDKTSENMVASLDIGRANDSTVLTVAKVWWENPQMFAGEDRYYAHVVNWLELEGDDHESQYPQILDFLEKYNIGILIVDATGRGDPIYDRLNADLYDRGVRVLPFIFSQRTKHEGYTVLYQELKEKRLTYPAGDHAKSQRKWQRFVKQMYDLQKEWRGKFMDVKAPTGGKKGGSGDGHDDYPDSLMLLCYAINRRMIAAEVGANPFVGSRAVANARRLAGAKIGDGGNRGRRKFDGW